MGLHYGVLRARPDRAKREDSIRSPHPEAIRVRADEPEMKDLGGTLEDKSIIVHPGIVGARLNCERHTSMTIPDSQPSACDETGRPEAPSSPGVGQKGWTPDGFLYDTFISYSRDNLDVADKIERELQTFPLPREIRRRLGRRHLNVFRDVNDLTGNRLDPALEHNLEQSRTLVVLCSPAARGSRYVSMEINRFAQLRDAEKIVPVLIAGGPNNDPGVDPAEWAFPDALGDVLGSHPLAADLRQAWSTKDRKAKLAAGSPWVQLVAGIVGATTDDLTDRIAKAERRRLQSIVGILVAVLAVVGLLVGDGEPGTSSRVEPLGACATVGAR